LTYINIVVGISFSGLKSRDYVFKYIPLETKKYDPFLNTMSLSYFHSNRKTKNPLATTHAPRLPIIIAFQILSVHNSTDLG